MIEGVPGSNAKDQSRAKTDMMQEMNHYGLHRHFTGGVSVVLFGGGMKKGFLYGETAPERPLRRDEEPGLHDATCTPRSSRRWASAPQTAFDVEKRPFYATEDGKGVAVPRPVRVTARLNSLGDHCVYCTLINSTKKCSVAFGGTSRPGAALAIGQIRRNRQLDHSRLRRRAASLRSSPEYTDSGGNEIGSPRLIRAVENFAIIEPAVIVHLDFIRGLRLGAGSLRKMRYCNPELVLVIDFGASVSVFPAPGGSCGSGTSLVSQLTVTPIRTSHQNDNAPNMRSGMPDSF